MRTAALIGLIALAVSGCAATSKSRVGYASWNHFVFSLRATWQQFVGWAPVATTTDEMKAAVEGGWWGEEVPTLPER